jgi:hypothetical protein
MCVLLNVPARFLERDWLLGLLLFLFALALYLTTLTPAVGTRDGYELQAISATLGFAHPTGYPLFPILGRLWISVFPLGDLAWRINVLCAVFAAASIPLLYGTARRLLGSRSYAAWSALLYACSPTLWTQASQPEKYTLNALFVALVLYIAFGTTDPERSEPHPYLYWLAFAYGLSLTHHRTMLMLAPTLVIYLLWRDPRLVLRPREWLIALCLFLAPLLVYLYIPWRAAAQGWYMTVSEFLRYVSGAYYGPAVRLLDWLSPERSQMFLRFLVAQYGYGGVVLGVLGLVGLGLRRRWRTLVCTALAYLAYYVWGTVWYAYYNDVNSFIPNHLLYAIWIGSGALTLWSFLESRILGNKRKDMRRYAKSAFWSLLALLPLSMLWTNGPQVDMSDEWNLTHWGRYAIAQDLPANATVLADREKHPPLDYYARVKGHRPDVDVAILGDEQAYLDRLAWSLAQGRPVYLARFLPGLEGTYHLRSLGPLVEVGTDPLTTPGGTSDTVAVWSTPGAQNQLIALLNYDLDPDGEAQPGQPLYVTLLWKALSPIPGNYQVNLRWVSDGGQVWWTSENHPVSGTYPTAAWKPGEVVPDWHEVPIPATLPPGEYILEVGWYQPFSSEGLSRGDVESWFPLRTIQVTAAGTQPRIADRLSATRPGEWRLLGYDLPDQAPPAGRVPLTLYWRALAPLPDYEIGIGLRTSDGEESWTWSVPGRGEYPTTEWPPGDVIATSHLLSMPDREGEVTLLVAIRPTGGEDRPLTFYPGWLASRTNALSLPPVAVTGPPLTTPGAANFDDRILMLSTDLGQRTLPPGAPLELAIRWQGIQAMEHDYTLFIHLLAPDGTLKGQIDVWPLDGTYPTSQWSEGKAFEDSYTVYVDPDAPPGAYQVAIGWYLLETMERLPVLDAEGVPFDDKTSLSGLTVSE